MINWLRDRKKRRKLKETGWITVLRWSNLSHCDAEYYFNTCQPRLAWMIENEIDYVILGRDEEELWLSPEDAMGYKLVWS